MKWHNRKLFLAKRGAERRAARFIISSRPKRACTTQASQSQSDFVQAINLSSLVGIRFDVIQSSDVKCIMGFQATEWYRRTKLWVLFMKTEFFTCELQQCLRSVSHRPISQANKENNKLNNGGFNKWLEILPGKDLQTKLRKSEDVNFKFSASNGTAKANTVN